MIFKPLTKSAPTSTALAEKKPEHDLGSTKVSDIVQSTEERIHIIYDDSGSMGSDVNGTQAIELAAEGTISFMKYCKPKVTAVEISPLNAELVPLSKNLPKLSVDIKKIGATNSTPIFEKLGEMVDAHLEKKYTRALIFTDGSATDSPREGLREQMLGLKIPIDFIIIGLQQEQHLSSNERMLKDITEKSGGQFLIVKDAADFKNKMKYFAPTLRHMLPAIASKES